MLIYQNQQDYYKNLASSESTIIQDAHPKRTTSCKHKTLTRKNTIFLQKLGFKVKEKKKQ